MLKIQVDLIMNLIFYLRKKKKLATSLIQINNTNFSAAYFYVGTGRRPSLEGAFRVRDERGSTGVIKRYRNRDVTLSLPEGKTLRDVKWFFVWCDDFSVNFGDIAIPKSLDFPRPQKVGSLKGVHEVVSDNIVIVDAQTLLIPNFSYDGEAPGIFLKN